MSEQNKALVRDLFERIWNDDLSVLEEHPGLQKASPITKVAGQVAEDQVLTLYDQLADGDWVVSRWISEATMNQDVMGIAAGTCIKTETIAMHRIVDGLIVEQHAQGSRIDGPRPWDMN